MEISGVQVWLVEGVKYNWTFVKIHTDQGITGIGEATNWPGSPIIVAACKHVGQLITPDPFAHTSYLYGTHLAENLSLTEAAKQLAIDRLVAVQEAVGPSFPIAVETHAMLNEPTEGDFP